MDGKRMKPTAISLGVYHALNRQVSRRIKVYMLGMDKEGVIRKTLKARTNGGCRAMEAITCKEMTYTAIRFMRRKLIFCGIARVGCNMESTFIGSSPWQIKRMSTDAVILTFTGSRFGIHVNKSFSGATHIKEIMVIK